jgi:hypothetical protein
VAVAVAVAVLVVVLVLVLVVVSVFASFAGANQRCQKLRGGSGEVTGGGDAGGGAGGGVTGGGDVGAAGMSFARRNENHRPSDGGTDRAKSG